jgi:hypothetical protein
VLTDSCLRRRAFTDRPAEPIDRGRLPRQPADPEPRKARGRFRVLRFRPRGVYTASLSTFVRFRVLARVHGCWAALWNEGWQVGGCGGVHGGFGVGTKACLRIAGSWAIDVRFAPGSSKALARDGPPCSPPVKWEEDPGLSRRRAVASRDRVFVLGASQRGMVSSMQPCLRLVRVRAGARRSAGSSVSRWTLAYDGWAEGPISKKPPTWSRCRGLQNDSRLGLTPNSASP